MTSETSSKSDQPEAHKFSTPKKLLFAGAALVAGSTIATIEGLGSGDRPTEPNQPAHVDGHAAKESLTKTVTHTTERSNVLLPAATVTPKASSANGNVAANQTPASGAIKTTPPLPVLGKPESAYGPAAPTAPLPLLGKPDSAYGPGYGPDGPINPTTTTSTTNPNTSTTSSTSSTTSTSTTTPNNMNSSNSANTRGNADLAPATTPIDPNSNSNS